MPIASISREDANLLLALATSSPVQKKYRKTVQFVSMVEVKLIQNLATQAIADRRDEYLASIKTKTGNRIENIKKYLKFRLVPKYDTSTDEEVKPEVCGAYNLEDIGDDPEGVDFVPLKSYQGEEQEAFRGTQRLIEHARKRGFLESNIAL